MLSSPWPQQKFQHWIPVFIALLEVSDNCRWSLSWSPKVLSIKNLKCRCGSFMHLFIIIWWGTATTNIALHQQGSVSLGNLWKHFKKLLQKGQTVMKIWLEFQASIQYWRAKYSWQLGWRSPCTKMQRKGAHPQGFCWVLANKGMLCFTCRNLGRSYLPSFC